ncbi:MAG: hypothetical protein WCK32_01445 [Chlorobiaceae bacterium]
MSKSIFQLKVTLVGAKPPIWRRILVADTITLGRLHDFLQLVYGMDRQSPSSIYCQGRDIQRSG